MLLASLSDATLAARVVDGDGDAFAELVRRFRSVIYAACAWAPVGIEREDLRQEALIGLFDACHRYDRSRGAFDKFAVSCAYYSAHRARRDAARLKHRVLSDALWHENHEDRDRRNSSDKPKPLLTERAAAAEGCDPARIVELREELRERVETLRWREQVARGSGRRLYSDEQIAHALALVEDGKSLHEAAAAVGTTHTRRCCGGAGEPPDPRCQRAGRARSAFRRSGVVATRCRRPRPGRPAGRARARPGP